MAPPLLRSLGARLLFALIASTALHIIAATFPLPIPTRPTSFPLSRPDRIGEVVVWGDNSLEQIQIPVDVTNVVAIAAGYNYTLALRSNGTVVAWGDNRVGDCDVPAGLSDVVAISTAPSVALKANGTVVTWGLYAPAIPANLNATVSVFPGPFALKANGTVLTWGPSNFPIPPAATNVIDVVPTGGLPFFLRGDGTIVNPNTSPPYIMPFRLDHVVSISAHGYNAAALRADGNVVPQTVNFDTPIGIRATAIACGGAYKLAILGDGSVAAWGDDALVVTSSPPRLRGVVAISAGDRHAVALKLPTPPIPTAAVATAQIVNGFIVDLIIDGGEGYDAPPQVTIAGGGGSGATATAQISKGVVTGFTINNAGIGYTSQPTIIIDPLPFLPRLNIAPSRVNVTMQVVPGKHYQLESSDDLPNFSPVGAPFTAASNTVTNEFTLSETGQFFRIQEVP